MFFYFFIVVSLASILKEGFHIKRCPEPIYLIFKKLVKESYQTTTKVQNSNLTKKIPKSSFFKICWFFSEKPRIFSFYSYSYHFGKISHPKQNALLGFLPNFGNMLKTIVVNNRVI